MDVFQHRYYKINYTLLKLIGLWPYQTKRERRFFVCNLLFWCTVQMGPEVFAIVRYRHDPDIITTAVSPFLVNIGCLAKLMMSLINSNKTSQLLDRIKANWQIWNQDREIKILHEYAEMGRVITIAYSVVVYSTVALFVTMAILPKIIDAIFLNNTMEPIFPFPVYYLELDEQKYYFYIIGVNYFAISMIVTITIANDSMFVVYVQHACGLFEALGQKLQHIGTIEKSEDKTNMELKYLATCIDRHNDAIEFAELIEGTYSICFFFIVGINMLLISTTSFQMVVGTNGPQETFRFVAFIGAQLMHLYVESYIAQMLMDHSTRIRDYIHSAEWYSVSIQSQKMLNLMAMRCNVPCTLTAGKICIMCIETFATVVKTSMSYFTLLRSMEE